MYKTLIYNMRTIIFTIILSFGLLLTHSCNSDEEPVVIDIDFGYDYFPLEVGQYRIYATDSIIYDFSGPATVIDTHSFEVQEIIVDTTTDSENRTIYIVHRLERELNTTDWQLKNVWTTVRTDLRAEWVENNHRFVKLVFPVKEEQTWNGNQFIDDSEIITIAGESLEMFKGWSYAVTSKGEAKTLNGFTFDDVVTTVQVDDENLIERRFSTEQYARGIGLIQRNMMILDTQCGGNLSNCAGQSWEEKAEKGYVYNMKLIEYN